jgi:hypothetical protein
MKLDERFKYILKVKDSVFKKLQEDSVGKKNMLLFILEDLQGVEKLYGLQMFFTTDDVNELTEEDKNLIITSHAVIVGDLMGVDSNKVNDIVDNIIDRFYYFDKLRDGYLVNHNFEEMEDFIQQRKLV